MADFLQRWKDRKITCNGIDLDQTELGDRHTLSFGIRLSAAPTEAWIEEFNAVMGTRTGWDFTVKLRPGTPLIMVNDVASDPDTIERAYLDVKQAVLAAGERFREKSADVLRRIEGLTRAAAKIDKYPH